MGTLRLIQIVLALLVLSAEGAGAQTAGQSTGGVSDEPAPGVHGATRVSGAYTIAPPPGGGRPLTALACRRRARTQGIKDGPPSSQTEPMQSVQS